jgi:hypothetical protein
MNISIAVDCLNDLATKIDSLNEFGQKIFAVYSEDDLFDKSKHLKFPAVGLMYEGMVSEGDPSRQGLSATLKVVVVLVLDGKTIANMDRKNDAARLLDAIRSSILRTNSPTQHKWRFASETPMGELNGVLLYLQRWETAAPLT